MNKDFIELEILNKSGNSIKLSDLGEEFLKENNIESDRKNNPVVIRMNGQQSKAGNTFYDFSQNGLNLPDKMETLFKIEDHLMQLSPTKPSKNGYLAVSAKKTIILDDTPYIASIYVSKSKMPYYLKVHLHKKPDNAVAIGKAQRKPKGGTFI